MEKKKRDLLPVFQTIATMVTAMVAACGIVLSYGTMKAQDETARSGRLSSAVLRLCDDNMAVRIGALYEFKKLTVDSPRDRDMILEILSTFVREGIETLSRERLWPEEEETWHDLSLKMMEEVMRRPKEDVFIAAEVISYMFTEYGLRADLQELRANGLDLYKFVLKGADLSGAQFQGSSLFRASLEGGIFRTIHSTEEIGGRMYNIVLAADFTCALMNATLFSGAILECSTFRHTDLIDMRLNGMNLSMIDFEGALFINVDLKGANLEDTYNLTAEQLLNAAIDDTTLLDPDLRAEYDRLKAARE